MPTDNGISSLGPPASPGQIEELRKLIIRKKLSDEELLLLLKDAYGCTALSGLTELQAIDLIDTLKRYKPEERRPCS